MKRFSRRAALLGAITVASLAHAGVYPPVTRELPLPPLTVRSESGPERPLQSFVQGSAGPVFLLPGYVACHGACPLLARTVRTALAERGPHRVIFLSFAGDDGDALADFRRREQLPPDWHVVAARSQAEAKTFLDRYGYSFEQRRGEFVHPNQVLVLRSDGRWAASLFVRDGLDGNAVARAFAMADDKAPWSARILAAITDPRWILAAGVLGFLAALTLVTALFFRRWRRPGAWARDAAPRANAAPIR